MFTSETSTKAGFDAVIKNESFKCAFITHSPAYAFGKVVEMKRHNETEEIFVLLKGRAVMLIYEDGIFSEYELSENTAYNVHKKTWHYLGYRRMLRFSLPKGRTPIPQTAILSSSPKFTS